MATVTDRYGPLKDATPGTASPSQTEPPNEEIAKNQPAIEQTAAAHDTRDATARIDQHGQPTRWPVEQHMDAQNLAASQLVKDRYEQRQNAQQQPEHDAPEPQKGEAKRELSFFEDKSAHAQLRRAEARGRGADAELLRRPRSSRSKSHVVTPSSGFRCCRRCRDCRMQVDTVCFEQGVLVPQHLLAGYRVEILDEDDLLIAFEHHQLVWIGELAL